MLRRLIAAITIKALCWYPITFLLFSVIVLSDTVMSWSYKHTCMRGALLSCCQKPIIMDKCIDGYLMGNHKECFVETCIAYQVKNMLWLRSNHPVLAAKRGELILLMNTEESSHWCAPFICPPCTTDMLLDKDSYKVHGVLVTMHTRKYIMVCFSLNPTWSRLKWIADSNFEFCPYEMSGFVLRPWALN